MNSSKDPILPTFKQWFPLVAMLEYCGWRKAGLGGGLKISCDVKTDYDETYRINLLADCIWRPSQVSQAFLTYFQPGASFGIY